MDYNNLKERERERERERIINYYTILRENYTKSLGYVR